MHIMERNDKNDEMTITAKMTKRQDEVSNRVDSSFSFVCLSVSLLVSIRYLFFAVRVSIPNYFCYLCAIIHLYRR